MGRSRGGLTTKIHAQVGANGRPLVLKLTPGQIHDGRSAADRLNGLAEGQILPANRAYDSNALREAMDKRGAWACIKPISASKDPPAFSPFLYRYRNLAERGRPSAGRVWRGTGSGASQQLRDQRLGETVHHQIGRGFGTTAF